MLWALEALRILDKSVSSALDTITEAEEKLLQIYNQGPGERHKELEKTADMIMEYTGSASSISHQSARA